MRCTYRSIGFLVSALVHLVAAAALLPRLGGGHPAVAETPVAVSLAMFRPAAQPRVAVEPAADPEMAGVPPTSPKTPSEPPPVEAKPEPPPPVPEPEPEAVSARDVEPRPRPSPVERRPSPIEPEQKDEPRRKPRSKPAPRPKPDSKPEPEPRVVPEPVRAPAAEQIPSVESEAVAPPATPDRQAAARPTAQPARSSPQATAAPGPAPSPVRDRYLRELVARIQQEKYYPSRARRRRQEGRVVVAFVIGRSGELSGLRISRSSGHDGLDRAAIKTLERISPLRALPPELGIGSWELAVPIDYRLRH